MAIGENDLRHTFGTQTEVVASGASVADAAFSAASSSWANTPSAPEAAFVLRAQWATVTGVANKLVNVYARPLDIQGTDDPVVPGVNRKAILVGSFVVYAAATATDYWYDAAGALPNMAAGGAFEFYLENLTGQTISAGWKLWVTPRTVGPTPAA